MSESTRFTLQIRFLSDWHIGEGAGRLGHIDRTIRRHPQDNLPYVPAKTLTGLLRDACEQVAQGLDGSTGKTDWQEFTQRLFGQRNTPAALAIGSARFSPGLRRKFAEQPAAIEALTLIKPGIKLDAQGVAEDRHLRIEELAVAGSVLQADMTLNATGAPAAAATALLWAGVLGLERIGARRRRGCGRCTCTLRASHLPAEEALVALLSVDPPVWPKAEHELSLMPSPAAAQKVGVLSTATPTVREWQRIPLRITLRTPVIIPAQTLGNLVKSRDYLPGTLLLAALNGPLRQQVGPAFAAAVAAGDIQIRNGYPATGPQRLLPVPMALFEVKQRTAAEPDLNLLHQDVTDAVQRKQLRAGFIAAEADVGEIPALFRHHVSVIVSTHAAVDDASQRPTTETGGVYTYEAMAAEQVLLAELCVRAGRGHDVDAAKLNGDYRLGVSKKDDFGLIQLEVQPSSAPMPSVSAPEGGVFTLWLTSCLLLRDARLRPSTDSAVLAARLAAELQLPPDSVKIDRSFQRVQREDGWQVAWRSPRPTRLGFAAGSCFLVKVADCPPADLADRLSALAAAGLGERRGEGYGELRIQHALLECREFRVSTRLVSDVPVESENGRDMPGAGRAGSVTRNAVPISVSAAAPLEGEAEFCMQIARRHYRAEIARRIRLAVSGIEPERQHSLRRALFGESQLSHHFSNAALGNLRAYLEGATDEAGRRRFDAWLAHERQKPTNSALSKVPMRFDGLSKQVWQLLQMDNPHSAAFGGTDVNCLRAGLENEAWRLLALLAVQTAPGLNTQAPNARDLQTPRSTNPPVAGTH